MSEASDVGQRERNAQNRMIEAISRSLPERCGSPPAREGIPARWTPRRRALYDNLDGDEELSIRADAAVRHTRHAREDDWRGHRFKEKKVLNAVREELGEYEVQAGGVFEIVKSRRGY